MREEVTEGRGRLCAEEFHDLYSSLSVAEVMKSRRMRWVAHIACMGKIRNAYRMLFIKF
jgi:hypothetical protein